MTDTSKLIEGRTGLWEVVLGLEVHAQVASNAKLFSGAAVGFGAGPNMQVSLVDIAMPGMLPVINKHCVEQAVKTGLGLKAQINLKSLFDRKNYFYPDLPQGYQISQFKDPIVGEGEVIVERDDGSTFTVRIERLHLEQDAGKSLHDQDPNATYMDYNRAGTALMEIVSRPDMRCSEEAAAYVKKLRTILVYLGTCDGDMEKGNLRADVNVSVCRPGSYDKFRETGDFGHLGTRCEIKNVNSYRFIQQAIEYEARRQIEILEDGGKIDQETRLFDSVKGETRSMRSKEEAHDYRYFPDPDLLPLVLDPAWVKRIEASLPELPDAKKARLQTQYGLTAYDAGVLIIDQARADFFEVAAKGRDAKLTANWVTNELAAKLTAGNLDISVSPIAPSEIAELVALIEEGVISSKIAKDVFERMWAGEGAPRAIVEKAGLQQVSDTGALEKIIDDLIAANPGQAASVAEKPQAIGWFVGQVMKATGGKANPGVINQLLKSKLGI
ncbi:Asp-tRNA(Asn)/Glu-tRNA(Gln) amidotransferase subunit GatB [Phenylobacterium aquaticum]|uniref:Asp-tRNA(Asn)/Glu-tRNA(Gln) amidotransferase subunit GatB n=1 Tax=Phenylobacterium aquaticum TaxID=1763816 RepID=UPI0026F239ED|nr:Asp-tRNA(Asn)/Glu-tRNA(Gln) amidotransferase subunit GatB [Phenylobacterium aquaticum]